MVKKIKGFFRSWKKVLCNIGFMFRYSWRLAKPQFFFSAVQTVLSSVQPMLLLIIPAKIIDELTNGKRWEVTLKLVLLLIGVEAAIALINIIISYVSALSNVRCSVRNDLEYEKLWIGMDYEKLENSDVRDLGTRVQNNISARGFVNTISAFITNLVQLAGYTYIIATLHPLMIAAILLFIFISSRIAKGREKVNYEYQPVLTKFSRRFQYLFTTMVNFDYGKEIRINNASEWLKNRYDVETDGYMTQFARRQRKEMKLNVFAALEAFAQTIVMYGYCAYKAIAGLITVGSFSMYLGAITAFTGSFTDVITKFTSLTYLSNYVEDYKHYIELSRPRHEEASLHIEDKNFKRHEIEFCDVSFKYPDTERFVLRHINIKINAGERLSVVGYNGAGKSTFIKLICRLYIPTEGKILYNGIDIQTIDYDEYRNLISVVFQDYKLFSMTVGENVVLNKAVDKAKLDISIEKSGLSQKIDTLPQGYDTQIGRQFDENGIEFSGGEGQKLACARAYYKDSPIIILDEPTASLDPVAESRLYERFNSIIEGKTSIYISHRLASVKFCDKVAVFADGEIAEYGTHESLMQKHGIYAEMFTKQSEYYVEQGGEALETTQN